MEQYEKTVKQLEEFKKKSNKKSKKKKEEKPESVKVLNIEYCYIGAKEHLIHPVCAVTTVDDPLYAIVDKLIKEFGQTVVYPENILDFLCEETTAGIILASKTEDAFEMMFGGEHAIFVDAFVEEIPVLW